MIALLILGVVFLYFLIGLAILIVYQTVSIKNSIKLGASFKRAKEIEDRDPDMKLICFFVWPFFIIIMIVIRVYKAEELARNYILDKIFKEKQ